MKQLNAADILIALMARRHLSIPPSGGRSIFWRNGRYLSWVYL